MMDICLARYAYDLDDRPVICGRPSGHEGQHTDFEHDAPATLNWGTE